MCLFANMCVSGTFHESERICFDMFHNEQLVKEERTDNSIQVVYKHLPSLSNSHLPINTSVAVTAMHTHTNTHPLTTGHLCQHPMRWGHGWSISPVAAPKNNAAYPMIIEINVFVRYICKCVRSFLMCLSRAIILTNISRLCWPHQSGAVQKAAEGGKTVKSHLITGEKLAAKWQAPT